MSAVIVGILLDIDNTVLVETLTGLQTVKKFLAFRGT